MTENKFAARIIAKNNSRLYYLCAQAKDGLDAWYIILLHPSKVKLFNEIPDDQAMNLKDYGEIIESGYGRHAPPEVIAAVNEKYECNFGSV